MNTNNTNVSNLQAWYLHAMEIPNWQLRSTVGAADAPAAQPQLRISQETWNHWQQHSAIYALRNTHGKSIGLLFVDHLSEELQVLQQDVDVLLQKMIAACKFQTVNLSAAPSGHLSSDFALGRVLVALGENSVQLFTDAACALEKIRNTDLQWGGLPVIASYHPATLLQTPGLKARAWQDLQRVMRLDAG